MKTVPVSRTGINGILLPQNFPICFEDCDKPSRTCHKINFHLISVDIAHLLVLKFVNDFLNYLNEKTYLLYAEL